MALSSAYGMVNVSSTIDGQQVTGLWDGDDAISIAPMTDKGTMLVGADGSSIFSVSANGGATITIRLQHKSPTHRLLTQKLARQKALGGAFSGFPATVFDTSSGEGGSADRCFIQSAPTKNNGTNATVREWVLVTGEIVDAVPNA
ncbi:DUF3277 family protein [Martelella lutilitoris]|uniref:DUF3277 family protein n=1 Tax=Martelella lutilitoris TaxID=2583532 RepID=A0A7T7HHM6_9HYPH|nr:phage protein [Martelella lutilitoris]QQM29294.1 DUF3277 family protein [Martelella lutilitoris]